MMTQAELIALLREESATFPPVTEEHALEAYHAALVRIKDSYDVLYVFACMNALNAYVKLAAKDSDFAKRYQFKRHVVSALEQTIQKAIDGVAVFFSPEVTYVQVFDLQFSFHNLAPTRALKTYASSPRNRAQEWTGIRLQPAASLILDWAKEVRVAKKLSL